MKQVQKSLSKSAKLLRDSFNLYSKMLAKEDIKVVYDQKLKSPAQFDILNRILKISPLDDSLIFLIPGLIVHEVGHALFSKIDKEEFKIIKKISKVLNIIDDGYQERMMCKKYPGAKDQLLTIFDHYFLDILNTNPDQLNNTGNKVIDIVNTLNFNCKGNKHNHHLQYPTYVTKDDQMLLYKAETLNEHSMLKRWEFSKEIIAMLKKYGEEVPEDNDEDEESESEDGDEGEGGDKDSSNTSSKNKSKKPGEGSIEEVDAQEFEDVLDKLLNSGAVVDHHKQFIPKVGGPTLYEVATGDQLEKIFPMIDVSNASHGFISKTNSNGTILSLFNEHNKIAKTNSIKLITEFNLRKAAHDLAVTQYRKSGTLDPTRAALYKVYDDVFESIAVCPDQVNHAYVIALDWSGSMSGSIKALMFRIMELAYFAEALNIELRVFAYTQADSNTQKNYSCLHQNTVFSFSRFFDILDTKKHRGIALVDKLKAFWYLTQGISGSKMNGLSFSCGNLFSMEGTNILESVLLGHHLLSKMQADNKTLIVLSDGGDCSFDAWYDSSKKIVTRSNGDISIMNVVLEKQDMDKVNITSKITDIYRSVNQKTIGVAWDCTPQYLEKYCDHVIVSKNNGQNNGTLNPYIYSENAFVKEIVKHII